MWLKYGVSSDGELKNIDEVKSGKTNLTCLYCSGGLTAKKGCIKEHHFAHSEETCKPVSQRIKRKAFPSLPLYDNFNIQLSGEELEQLKVLWREYGASDRPIPRELISFRLILRGLFQPIPDRLDEYEFTNLGKIPVGALPLSIFNQVQEPLLLEELTKYQRSAEVAQAASLSCTEERLADLRIYQIQLRQILLNSLYFLEIKTEDRIFHKIGITTRTIEQRIAEVQRDLREHFSTIRIDLLGLWEHRGNVELYFKHRYQAFNYRIGTLTEYFQFPKVKTILNDLYGMEIKQLNAGEREILGEGPIAIP